jgi:hypothetical protein
MSVDLVVYMARPAMAEPNAWARAIVDAGFPAELDSDFDVETFTGFLPFPYDGVEAGFEYFSGPVSPEEADGLPSNVDFSVTFATGSRMRDLASSVVSAAVLCVLTGGVLLDPQAGMTVTAGEAMAWARSMLEGIATDIAGEAG